MSSTEILNKVADVLEAVALEKEKLATELQTIKQEKLKDTIAPIVEKIAFLDKNTDQDALVSKLSSLDEETLSILSRAAGAEVSELGGYSKLASVNNNQNNAENAFASWIIS